MIISQDGVRGVDENQRHFEKSQTGDVVPAKSHLIWSPGRLLGVTENILISCSTGFSDTYARGVDPGLRTQYAEHHARSRGHEGQANFLAGYLRDDSFVVPQPQFSLGKSRWMDLQPFPDQAPSPQPA